MTKQVKNNDADMNLTWERASLSWAATALCALLGLWGCLAIYSTQIVALHDWGFLGRQIIFLFVGLPLLVGCWKIPFHFYEKYGWILGIAALAAVVSVLFFGTRINGMAGWFEPFPSFRIQPSELAKPFYLLSLYLLWRKLSSGGNWKAVFTVIIAGMLFAVPVALEPDYGSAAIFLTAMVIFLFISGAKIRELVISFIIFAAAVGAAAAWRWELICRRIDALGSGDIFGNGWHVKLFQLAISRGGWTGAKQGNSIWTENYLPLAHNDSIFAAMTEVLGLLGTLPLLAMLGALIYLLLKLAWKCDDSSRKIFIAATAFIIGVQSLLHISVNVTLLPPSGLTLPFISYGGSSLISTMILIGIALSAANAGKDGERG